MVHKKLKLDASASDASWCGVPHTGVGQQLLISSCRNMIPNVSTVVGSGEAGFADGAGASAQFSYPRGIASDGAGNVFIADWGNNRIRKIDAGGVFLMNVKDLSV